MNNPMSHDEKCAIAAIKVWCYWCSNWGDPAEWIYEIWGKGCLGDHFYNKFTVECDCKMDKFYRELSANNQEKLSSWVLRNYHP